ncbi:unnamed protein product [Urochloa humidicola]
MASPLEQISGAEWQSSMAAWVDSDSSSSSCESDPDAKALPQNCELKENVLPVNSLDQEKGIFKNDL